MEKVMTEYLKEKEEAIQIAKSAWQEVFIDEKIDLICSKSVNSLSYILTAVNKKIGEIKAGNMRVPKKETIDIFPVEYQEKTSSEKRQYALNCLNRVWNYVDIDVIEEFVYSASLRELVAIKEAIESQFRKNNQLPEQRLQDTLQRVREALAFRNEKRRQQEGRVREL